MFMIGNDFLSVNFTIIIQSRHLRLQVVVQESHHIRKKSVHGSFDRLHTQLFFVHLLHDTHDTSSITDTGAFKSLVVNAKNSSYPNHIQMDLE